MSSTKKKKTAKKGKKETGPIHTTKNSEPTTYTKGRRSASPVGQPTHSPGIPSGGDDKDGSTQGVLSMALQTDQLSAAIIDSSQERGWYDDKNTSAISSDIPQLLQVIIEQMKNQAERLTQLEIRAEQQAEQLEIRAERQAEQQAQKQDQQMKILAKILAEKQAQQQAQQMKILAD